MNRNQRPAFTLIELIVAMFIGVLIFGLVISLFIKFRQDSQSPMASMSMEMSTVTLVRRLQRDLSETNLQSIHSDPNGQWVGFASARDAKDILQWAPTGIVQWQKYVYYRVSEYTSSVPPPPKVNFNGTQIVAACGNLTCQETPVAPIAEAITATDPASVTMNSGEGRFITHNIMINKTDGTFGCFAYYPDATTGTPTYFDAAHRGEPVCLAIYLMDVSSSSGQPTLRHLSMQIKPKN